MIPHNQNLLFSPIRINNLKLSNRIIFAPMHNNLNAPDGSVTQNLINYFEERAEAKPGVMLTPFTSVRLDRPLLGAYSEAMIPGLSQLCKAVQRRGSRLFLQLALQGGKAEEDPVAPSAISSKLYKSTPREFTIEEIESLIRDFIIGVERAQIAGFDGVELHGGHTYLVGQFVSPHTNRRKDKYGGNFENRMRFPQSIVQGIRGRLGDDFPLGFKFSAHEHLENGVELGQAVNIAKFMEEAGVDYLHVSSTSSTIYAINNEYIECNFPSVSPIYSPHSTLSELSSKIKENVNIPVVGVGAISSAKDAEEMLENNHADLVAVGRAFLADSKWPEKVRKGKEIRPCIRCNKCHERAAEGKEVRCAVNSNVGREAVDLLPVRGAKKIVVVGGGPAGMQVAFTASQRGHEVILYEQDEELGGKMKLGSLPDFKQDLKSFLHYFRRLIDSNNIQVRTKIKVSLDTLIGENPDKIVLATGSSILRPDVPGIDGDHVLLATEYFDQYTEFQPSDRAIVIGAGLVGSEIALDLSSKCEQVVLADMLEYNDLLRKEHPTNRSVLIKMLKEQGVQILGQHKLREIKKEGVKFTVNGEEKFQPADRIILALGLSSRTRLRDELEQSAANFDYYQIGDCLDPRDIYSAIQDGYEIGSKI